MSAEGGGGQLNVLFSLVYFRRYRGNWIKTEGVQSNGYQWPHNPMIKPLGCREKWIPSHTHCLLSLNNPLFFLLQVRMVICKVRSLSWISWALHPPGWNHYAFSAPNFLWSWSFLSLHRALAHNLSCHCPRSLSYWTYF